MHFPGFPLGETWRDSPSPLGEVERTWFAPGGTWTWRARPDLRAAREVPPRGNARGSCQKHVTPLGEHMRIPRGNARGSCQNMSSPWGETRGKARIRTRPSRANPQGGRVGIPTRECTFWPPFPSSRLPPGGEPYAPRGNARSPTARARVPPLPCGQWGNVSTPPCGRLGNRFVLSCFFMKTTWLRPWVLVGLANMGQYGQRVPEALP